MRQLWLTLIASLLVLVTGCRQDPVPQESSPAIPASPERATSPDSTQLEETSTSRLHELASDSNGTPSDPLAEGWEFEEFNQQANSRLKQLGKLVTSPEFKASHFAELSATSFAATELQPEDLERAYQGQVFEVERLSQDFQLSRDSTSIAAAFKPLWERFGQLQDPHFKFKVFRVSEDGDEFVTKQYVQFSGFSEGHSVEQNSTWIIGWQPNRPKGAPTIAWIELVDFEQVTSTQAGGGRLLVDCTRSVLQSVPAYESTLLPGIGHWRERLEKEFAIHNFGHHGLALGDVNGDDWDDIYVCQTGGLPNLLLIRQPDGTVVDGAAEAGVDYLDNTRSALFLDLDNDGDQDLVLSLTSGLLLAENDGAGRYRLRARIPSVREGFSLAAADYDQDGWTDLFVCVYYGAGNDVSELPLTLPYFDATNGGANHLIRNHGDWKFSEVTEAVGLDTDNRRFSFAAAWEDDDNDGDLDLLIVNDFGPNQLFRNDSGQFKDVASDIGLRDGAFGMSATWGDFDHDGRFDIYVSNMFSAAGNRVTFTERFKPDSTQETRAKYQYLARGNSLFRNRGSNHYDDVSETMRVTMGRWSWASLFVDLNNDSWEDLLVTNGFITGRDTEDL